MLRRLTLAASLVTVLTVTACGTIEQVGGASADEQPSADSQRAPAQASTLSAPAEAGVVPLDPGVPGLPVGSGASIDDVLRLGAIATWVDAPGVLALSLPATGACWASAGAPTVESASELVVEFTGAAACGMPQTARTYTVRVPEGIDPAAELTVSIEGLATPFALTLPAT